MALKELWLHNVRNLEECTLTLDSRLLWFSGDNGAGKSSLLEAVFLLGHGRSFRTNSLERVIKEEAADTAVAAVLAGAAVSRMGLRRFRNGKWQVRIDGEDVKRLSLLAEHLPVQILTPDSYGLLGGGPRERRRFLDWAVFHVEHSFVNVMRRYGHALEQRNALLKSGGSDREFLPWETELANAGMLIDQHRRSCWQEFLGFLQARLGSESDLSWTWHSGWADDKQTLFDSLVDARSRDRLLKTTGVGPHRADFKVKCGKMPADEKLSRGQMKMLVQAMYLALSELALQSRHRKGILLLDDFGTELDQARQHEFLDSAMSLDCLQVWVTSTLSSPPELAQRYNARTFHVEHGVITPVSQDYGLNTQ